MGRDNIDMSRGRGDRGSSWSEIARGESSADGKKKDMGFILDPDDFASFEPNEIDPVEWHQFYELEQIGEACAWCKE